MLNARGIAPRATMSHSPLVFSLSRSLFSLSFSLSFFLSSTWSTDIYGIFFIARPLHSAPFARSLARSRLVLSRRGPGDQKRFNLRYHRWRAKPSRVSSPDPSTDSIYVTRPELHVIPSIDGIDEKYSFPTHSKKYRRVIFRRARSLISLIVCFH